MALALDDFYEVRDIAEIAHLAGAFRFWVFASQMGEPRIGVEKRVGMHDAKAAVFAVDSAGAVSFLYGDVDDVAWPQIPERYVMEAMMLAHYGGVTA